MTNRFSLLVGVCVLLFVPLAHLLGVLLGIYTQQIETGFVWFDNVLHLLVGFGFSLLVFSATTAAWRACLIVFVLAVLWEVVEMIMYLSLPELSIYLKTYSPTLFEAAQDVASNMGGFIIVWMLKKYV
jgi:hypothetical protein